MLVERASIKDLVSPLLKRATVAPRRRTLFLPVPVQCQRARMSDSPEIIRARDLPETVETTLYNAPFRVGEEDRTLSLDAPEARRTSQNMLKNIDYTLYLVTGRDLLPPGKDFYQTLEESIQGGVTIVQLREKDLETSAFVELAVKSKVICDKYNVPLLINDRVDVALAAKADGVHLGQSDMAVKRARELLPHTAIIGLSCNTVEHVKGAIKQKVDYIGIGAVWDTKTKKLTNPVIGIHGVADMLAELEGTSIEAVAIGGINSVNLLRTLHGCVTVKNRSLDGVAVVSDIMASADPRCASKKLKEILVNFQRHHKFYCLRHRGRPDIVTVDSVVNGVAELMDEVKKERPLVHQITNTVVSTQSANVTLAIGASPIMATESKEMEDLSRICGGLLVNIGTMRAENLDGMMIAGTSANVLKKPIVFDPVGVGASNFRKNTVKGLLNKWQASVIKGNAGELAALAGTDEVESKGVDSVGSGFKNPAEFVRNLAKRERCVVVLTGPVDYISDGISTVCLENGHELLERITGSGCILGSIIASYCAASSQTDTNTDNGGMFRGDMFTAAIAGVLVLTVAAELAAKRHDVKGPGSFLPALIDELSTLTPEQVREFSKVTVKHL
ncbi:putative thiamine biosynthetic bifunctional enzyme [Psilocybe cubensis]|uniref:Thiamine biosynthetic bifunctional enzyme n=2 Tax=Psilocybe cubensis TaxID=181762 RepID=A0ACB8HAR5_PSICU|nr:putative thiamine biosynthetic bifunctional enzyme [Psilocybe cubensis]KAH9484936.1 putative thiamine biosynthetic bifunctional enzyme [Psilocybe cubensis]